MRSMIMVYRSALQLLLQLSAPNTYLTSPIQRVSAVAVLRFTDRWLQSVAPPDQGRLEYTDLLCPGLHVRITGRGLKTFSAMMRVHGRLQRRTIGLYPAFSLAEARAKTLAMMRGAAEGIDPRQPRLTLEKAPTYAELVEQYTEKHLKPNARSWRNLRANLLHPALRHLRTRSVITIMKADLVEVLDSLVAAGKPQAAVNLLRTLKMLWNWAADRDIIIHNPTERIRPPAKPHERDRVLLDVEIAAIWQASFQLPAPYGQMYRMFLLTGQRRGEVATMRWCEVADDLWTIPREKVKKDRSHAVPLTATALATIRSLPCYGADTFVFSTTGGASPSSNFSKVKQEMDRLCGVSDWTIHDLRRTVRSKLAELGVPREVARKVLNHEDGKVDRIYNRHEYLAEKREALERWEKKLLSLSSSDEQERLQSLKQGNDFAHGAPHAS